MKTIRDAALRRQAKGGTKAERRSSLGRRSSSLISIFKRRSHADAVRVAPSLDPRRTSPGAGSGDVQHTNSKVASDLTVASFSAPPNAPAAPTAEAPASSVAVVARFWPVSEQ